MTETCNRDLLVNQVTHKIIITGVADLCICNTVVSNASISNHGFTVLLLFIVVAEFCLLGMSNLKLFLFGWEKRKINHARDENPIVLSTIATRTRKNWCPEANWPRKQVGKPR